MQAISTERRIYITEAGRQTQPRGDGDQRRQDCKRQFFRLAFPANGFFDDLVDSRIGTP